MISEGSTPSEWQYSQLFLMIQYGGLDEVEYPTRATAAGMVAQNQT